jgi:transcriptional regulator with XRE-family HTH domain
MTSNSHWATMPAAITAARAGDYARILRLARTAAGLTLEQAGQLAGYSPSALSRLETGHRRTCDPLELRRLAELYQIPAALLGLSPPTHAPSEVTLRAAPDDDGDPMRRRSLLASGVLAVTGAFVAPMAPVEAAGGLTETLEDVLSGQVTAPALPPGQLLAQIASARADFRTCRYTRLTRRLPRLLAQSLAGFEQTPTDQRAAAAGHLAQAYNVATDLLTKLHDDGMAWATSDRATHAARVSADPLINAETARLAAIVLRRTNHRAGAQRMIVSAAEQLASTTKLTEPEQAAEYAQLLATAAYTAAVNDQRDTATTLLEEAVSAQHQASAGAPSSDSGFSSLDLAVYRIGVARALGDYGTAVRYAQLIDPAQITSPSRRARYWEDTALSLHGRGRPEATYRALLAAEQDTPEEVRFRPWAQHLTQQLLVSDTRHALPDIRGFAARIGAHP